MTVLVLLLLVNYSPKEEEEVPVRKKVRRPSKIKKVLIQRVIPVVICIVFIGGGFYYAKEGGVMGGEELIVYNWGEYIDPDVLTMFEEETGIHVVYEEFETNEILYPKVSSGAIAYDVVCPSDYMIQRMIENDLLSEINFDNIPNLKNIGKQYLEQSRQFDPENKWFKKHINLVKSCRELAGNDFYVDMPDLMENIDVLASLRGAQETLFDLLDEPEKVGERIQEVTDVYYDYYDCFYDAIKDEEGGNAYTVFQIWGPGRTVKLQCDFSAMMSPEDFRKYIQPSLRTQSENVDHVLYHLDGPQAIKHMDALMEIDGIDALQWTSGDAGPDGTLPDWDVIYDKAIAAGKSIWVKVYSGEFEDWIRNVDRLVKKYGSHSLFLLFPEMSMEQAVYLLDYAEKNWSDVKGTFCESLGR